MKIDKIININSKVNFKSEQKNHKFCNNEEKYIYDKFEKDNILSAKFSKNGCLEKIEYKTFLTPAKAILSLVNTNNDNIIQSLLYHMHTSDELEEMALDVASDDFLKSLNIKKLIGLGAFSLVFEMDNGKILKLTNGEHYPNKRKPDFFDLPVEKRGKSCRTCYYIEEKISQDNITQVELKEFVKKIEEKGYFLRDYLNFEPNYDDNLNFKIRIDQFGKTKDGKLYLIDPGCVLPPKKSYRYFKLLKKFFK